MCKKLFQPFGEIRDYRRKNSPMKKIISLFLVITLILGTTFALAEETDISGMSLEELQKLKDEINQAISDKKIEEGSTQPITSLSLTENKVTINVPDALNVVDLLKIQPSDASTAALKYAVSNTKIGYFEEAGVFQTFGPGTGTITITDEATKKTAKLQVTVKQPVTLIQISPNRAYVDKGKTIKLTATVSPDYATNKKLTWTSEDESVAKVSANGTVTGVSAGTVNITARAQDDSNKAAAIRVTVNVPVKKISFSEKATTIAIGKSVNLGHNVEPADATDNSLRWSSSNSSIASVNSNGMITGKAVGQCTITVEANDGSGAKASHTVYVEPQIPCYIDYLRWETRNGSMTGRIQLDVVSNCVNRKIHTVYCTIECYAGEKSSPSVTYYWYEGANIAPGKRVTSRKSSMYINGLIGAKFVEITITSVHYTDGTAQFFDLSEQAQTKTRYELR